MLYGVKVAYVLALDYFILISFQVFQLSSHDEFEMRKM